MPTPTRPRQHFPVTFRPALDRDQYGLYNCAYSNLFRVGKRGYVHLTTPTLASLHLIPDGAPGINATLRVMSQLVRQSKKSMKVRDTALRLTKDCAPKDWSCEVRVLHAFVRDRIRYVSDITDVETVATPDKILEQAAGDCDDKSVLLAALLESIGHPTRFIAIGFERGIFSHVYIETAMGGGWLPLETTEDVEAGWSPDPKVIVERMYWHN